MAGVKGKSGGKREGAGRPVGIKQKPIPLKIDLDLLAMLANVKNRNGFINDAIREKLERELEPE